MAVADFVPIAERDAAVDALLGARRQLAEVRDSTLAGLPLWNCMAQAIAHVDAAISELRRKGSTTTLPARRTPYRASSQTRRGSVGSVRRPAGNAEGGTS